jgi:hypothetical protein
MHRLRDAQLIGLVSTVADCVEGDGFALIPACVAGNGIETVSPLQSIRSLSLAKSEQANAGWLARPDLYLEAAEELLAHASALQAQFLVAEAGYSRLGDAVLDRRPHFVAAGRPFLMADVSASSSVHLAQVLRWSRSNRLLAVLTADDPRADFKPVVDGAFIADVLDCDSVMLTNLRSRALNENVA